MANKTLSAITAAFFSGIIFGFASIVLLCILNMIFTDFDGGTIAAMVFGAGIFGNGFLSFLLCLFIYLPICAYDKNNIRTLDFKELIKRYSPILTVPSGVIFYLAYFAKFIDGSDSDATTIWCISIFCLSSCSLWVFTKTIKSNNNEDF